MERPKLQSPFDDFTIITDSSNSEDEENFEEVVSLEKEKQLKMTRP